MRLAIHCSAVSAHFQVRAGRMRSFIQGASIELSADGPMREPYIAYMQGGLTYESGKLGIMMAVSAMLE